jgi:glutathione S-transferase
MVKFELIYFFDGGRGSPIRDILNFVEADWIEINPEWPLYKKETPFGYIPLLNIIEDNGEKWQLAEGNVIELYLARRFGLISDDLKESSIQLQIYNQITELWLDGGAGYIFFPEGKDIYKKYFDKVLDILVKNHEKWLKNNGSNGHYHGNKFTLTDIVLYSWTRFYHANNLAQQINEEDTPEIYKVYKTVKNYKNIKDYDYEAKTQGLDEKD